MKNYRVIIPTSFMCYDKIVTAENRKAAANEFVTEIKNNHPFIVMYGVCVEEA